MAYRVIRFADSRRLRPPNVESLNDRAANAIGKQSDFTLLPVAETASLAIRPFAAFQRRINVQPRQNKLEHINSNRWSIGSDEVGYGAMARAISERFHARAHD